MTAYRSPTSGLALTPDTPHSLRSSTGERWPVVDGIAYLRAGSEALAADVLAALDRKEHDMALMLLLAEQDRWWDGPLPDAAALTDLLANRDRLSLREAMDRLAYGRVGTYFAHRWSDPTFVAGLALTDACWTQPHTVFELACGIGHYLRELVRLGVEVTGADIVFSKLWLARHWVCPTATFVCMDAAAPFAVTGCYDLAICHDAFYFFEDKPAVATQLQTLAPCLLLAHIHNRDAANLSGAAAITLSELRAIFPGGQVFGDEELTAASIEQRPPNVLAGTTEAFALVLPPIQVATAFGSLSRPAAGTPLRRNPLLGDMGIDWPSERYHAEYGARATYREHLDLPETTIMSKRWVAHVARRELLDLPARW